MGNKIILIHIQISEYSLFIKVRVFIVLPSEGKIILLDDFGLVIQLAIKSTRLFFK